MSLDSLYLVSQIVTVVVIIATLIAILSQGYQTNKIARAELTRNWWMAVGAMNQTSVVSDDKAALMTRVFDLSERLLREVLTRMTFHMHAQVGVSQAAYALHRRGLVEEIPFLLARRANAALMISPIARAWRRANCGNGYEADFQGILDAMVSDAEAKANAKRAGGEKSA